MTCNWIIHRDVDFESNIVDILFTSMVIRPSRGQWDSSALHLGFRLSCQEFLGMCHTCSWFTYLGSLSSYWISHQFLASIFGIFSRSSSLRLDSRVLAWRLGDDISICCIVGIIVQTYDLGGKCYHITHIHSWNPSIPPLYFTFKDKVFILSVFLYSYFASSYLISQWGVDVREIEVVSLWY
jgi:hypothetical protein